MSPDPSPQADEAPDAAARDLLWMARIKQGDTDALRLLIEAHQGDTGAVRRLGSHFLSIDPASENADGVRWHHPRP